MCVCVCGLRDCVFFRFCGRRRPAAALRVGSRRVGGGGQPPILEELRSIAADFLAAPTPGVAGGWGGGGGNCISNVYTSYHSFSWFLLFFDVFQWF